MNDIHKTRAPQVGPTYAVSKRWMNVVSLFIGSGVMAVFLMAGTLYKLNGQLEQETRQTLIWKQRTEAMNEILIGRERISRFSYQWACLKANQDKAPCLENPQWRVDSDKYPLLWEDGRTGAAFYKEGEENK